MPTRDPEKRREIRRRCYERHREEICKRARDRYLSDPEKGRNAARMRVSAWRERMGEEGKRKRQEERRRAAEAKGRTYRTAEERRMERRMAKMAREAAIEAKRKARADAGKKKNVWVKRLSEELPDLYDERLSADALLWRARYHLDPAFRAREIDRTSKRDAKATLFDDGSLTPDVVRALFSVRVCPYCGKQMDPRDKTLDHIVPRRLGGWHSARNALVCCRGCNSRKKAQAPEVWIGKVGHERRQYVQSVWDKTTRGLVGQSWLSATFS